MRVLLDNSIFAHSQFAEGVLKSKSFMWGKREIQAKISGFVRKPLDVNGDYQAQKNSLFTVGRLIREKQLEAFTYNELFYEALRRRIGEITFDALENCQILECEPAVERSRFHNGDFFEFISKGSTEKHRKDVSSSLGQIPFVQWLCNLTENQLSKLLEVRSQLHLTDFEVSNLRHLNCFQEMCRISASPKHYPDMLHLWTAQCNQMDVFLTLEKKLPALALRIEKALRGEIRYATAVLRPIEFLSLLGITQFDPVPLEVNRFYPVVGPSEPL